MCVCVVVRADLGQTCQGHAASHWLRYVNLKWPLEENVWTYQNTDSLEKSPLPITDCVKQASDKKKTYKVRPWTRSPHLHPTRRPSSRCVSPASGPRGGWTMWPHSTTSCCCPRPAPPCLAVLAVAAAALLWLWLRWTQNSVLPWLLWASSCSSWSSCWSDASGSCWTHTAACLHHPGLTTRRGWRGVSLIMHWCRVWTYIVYRQRRGIRKQCKYEAAGLCNRNKCPTWSSACKPIPQLLEHEGQKPWAAQLP